MSRPNHWRVSTNHLKSLYKGDKKRGFGRDFIQKTINELIENGYAKRETMRGEDGRVTSLETIVYESKQEKEVQEPDYPAPANAAHSNKGILISNDSKSSPEFPSSPCIEVRSKENSSCRDSDPIKQKPKAGSKKDCDFVALSETSFGRVDFLFSLMKENNPKAKSPNREKWAKDIDKLHRIDGYSFEEIDALIRFSQEDEFWRTNILSAAKLRKQAPQLSLKMKKEGLHSKEHEDALENYERHKEYARYWVDRAERNNRVKPGIVWAMNEKAKINTEGEAIYIFYSENAFKEQFDNALRKIGAI
jgi:hypothetical protein